MFKAPKEHFSHRVTKLTEDFLRVSVPSCESFDHLKLR